MYTLNRFPVSPVLLLIDFVDLIAVLFQKMLLLEEGVHFFKIKICLHVLFTFFDIFKDRLDLLEHAHIF